VSARWVLSRRLPLIVVASAPLIGLLVWLRWSTFVRRPWSDLDVYASGGAAILRGESLFQVNVNGLHFTYSPFAAALFTPLSLAPAELSRWLFTAGSLACYMAIVVIGIRSTRIGWLLGGVVGAAGLAFEPFFTNISLGQINLYLILMVTLDCLVVPARHRGWLVGLAAGIKIVPGAFILYFALKRDWSSVRRTLMAFALSVACGALVAPRDSWRYWSGGFMDVSRLGTNVAWRGDNQSLSAEAIRLTHDVNVPQVLLLAISALAMLFAVVVTKQQLDAQRPFDAMVALGLGSLLASPVSWTHHWLWVVPLLLVTVSRKWWITSLGLGIVFLIGPMWLVPMYDLREVGQNWWQGTLSASYVLLGIGILIRLFLTRPPRTTGLTFATAGEAELPGRSGLLRSLLMTSYSRGQGMES
jgi:alpha-1,2-mannosyltransferase